MKYTNQNNLYQFYYLGSIHFLEVGVGWRNPHEHECKISQPSLYIFC